MTLLGTTELRNLPQLIDTTPRDVNADEVIATLRGDIQNSDVTVLTIQCTMSTAGKYYIVDANNKRHYLTDPDNNYPAGLLLLSTFFVKKGDECNLQFSNSGEMESLIVTMGAGIY